MNVPIEIITKIISYIPKKKCYRCNKQISILDIVILHNNKTFCSNNCIEYQH